MSLAHPVVALLLALTLSALALTWIVFCLAGMANLEVRPIHLLITWAPLILPTAAWLNAVVSIVRTLRQ